MITRAITNSPDLTKCKTPNATQSCPAMCDPATMPQSSTVHPSAEFIRCEKHARPAPIVCPLSQCRNRSHSFSPSANVKRSVALGRSVSTYPPMAAVTSVPSIAHVAWQSFLIPIRTQLPEPPCPNHRFDNPNCPPYDRGPARAAASFHLYRCRTRKKSTSHCRGWPPLERAAPAHARTGKHSREWRQTSDGTPLRIYLQIHRERRPSAMVEDAIACVRGEAIADTVRVDERGPLPIMPCRLAVRQIPAGR